MGTELLFRQTEILWTLILAIVAHPCELKKKKTKPKNQKTKNKQKVPGFIFLTLITKMTEKILASGDVLVFIGVLA